MKDKNIRLCPICEYSQYDVIGDRGWNCLNNRSNHYTRFWDLPVVTDCECFRFATGSCRKWAEEEVKRAEAKQQTTLGDF